VNAIQKYEPLPVATMQDLLTLGEFISRSGMAGEVNPAAGVVIAATCHQQGISIIDFQRTYHIIKGKPSMRSDAMLAEFRKLGGKVKIIENSCTRAAAEFAFDGNKGVFEYTMQDAERTGDCLNGGKIKDMWQKRPDDMLWARLVSRTVRKLAPEICSGLYTPEEVSDFDDRSPRAKPVPLTQDEILARAKVVTPEPEPKPEPAAAKSETIDVEADWGVE
jgi:hypothetical protein